MCRLLLDPVNSYKQMWEREAEQVIRGKTEVMAEDTCQEENKTERLGWGQSLSLLREGGLEQ